MTGIGTLTKRLYYSLASGAPVSQEVAEDVLNAESKGKLAKEMLMQEHFVAGSSEKVFFDPIKRLKLKTMEAFNKGVKLTSSQGKVCILKPKLWYVTYHKYDTL